METDLMYVRSRLLDILDLACGEAFFILFQAVISILKFHFLRHVLIFIHIKLSFKVRDSTVILDVGWRVSLEDHSVGDHWIDLGSRSIHDCACFERLKFGQEVISFRLQVDDLLLHLA